MTDTSLFTAGTVLLQDDTNGDSHPCTYFSKTFIPTERNYDIYECELLAVILTLKEWKQYVQGTSHPVTIITDHKNHSYIKDPRKLSQHQACWSLFLQDFDIVWKVLPGTKMAPADALSHHDSIDTSLDNVDTSIIPEPVVINTLDLALAHHTKSSSSSDPLVLHALSNLMDGSPLFPHSALKDWTFDNGHLYFKGRMYVPPAGCSSLLHSIHNSCQDRFNSEGNSESQSYLPTFGTWLHHVWCARVSIVLGVPKLVGESGKVRGAQLSCKANQQEVKTKGLSRGGIMGRRKS